MKYNFSDVIKSQTCIAFSIFPKKFFFDGCFIFVKSLRTKRFCVTSKNDSFCSILFCGDQRIITCLKKINIFIYRLLQKFGFSKLNYQLNIIIFPLSWGHSVRPWIYHTVSLTISINDDGYQDDAENEQQYAQAGTHVSNDI